MSFRQYQHLERYNSALTEKITHEGPCHIFPKLDGANGSVWLHAALDDNESNSLGNTSRTADTILRCGSRRHELSINNNNRGFFQWVHKHSQQLEGALREWPLGYRIYGEWLVSHSIKYYNKDAYNKFYIFDVVDCDGRHLTYEEYQPVIERYNLLHVPLLAILEKPTYDELLQVAEKDRFLLPEQSDFHGEGIVIKNYKYCNRFNNTIWAKLITSEIFPGCHNMVKGSPAQSEKLKNKERAETIVEKKIVHKYVTAAFLEKCYIQTLDAENAVKWSNTCMLALMLRVYDTLIYEEAYNFIQFYKNPNINFNYLQNLCRQQTRMFMEGFMQSKN